MGELGWSICPRDSGTQRHVGWAVLVNLKANLGSNSGDSIGSDIASWPGFQRRKLILGEPGQRRQAVESMPSEDSPLMMMDDTRSLCPVDSTSFNSS